MFLMDSTCHFQLPLEVVRRRRRWCWINTSPQSWPLSRHSPNCRSKFWVGTPCHWESYDKNTLQIPQIRKKYLAYKLENSRPKIGTKSSIQSQHVEILWRRRQETVVKNQIHSGFIIMRLLFPAFDNALFAIWTNQFWSHCHRIHI